jgi:hypothetical protein
MDGAALTKSAALAGLPELQYAPDCGLDRLTPRPAQDGRAASKVGDMGEARLGARGHGMGIGAWLLAAVAEIGG